MVWTLLEGIVGALIVFGLDELTGSEISVGVFYLFPVFRVAWKAGRKWALANRILSSALWMIADRNSNRSYSTPMIAYWNTAVRFGFFFSCISFLPP